MKFKKVEAINQVKDQSDNLEDTLKLFITPCRTC